MENAADAADDKIPEVDEEDLVPLRSPVSRVLHPLHFRRQPYRREEASEHVEADNYDIDEVVRRSPYLAQEANSSWASLKVVRTSSLEASASAAAAGGDVHLGAELEHVTAVEETGAVAKVVVVVAGTGSSHTLSDDAVCCCCTSVVELDAELLDAFLARQCAGIQPPSRSDYSRPGDTAASHQLDLVVVVEHVDVVDPLEEVEVEAYSHDHQAPFDSPHGSRYRRQFGPLGLQTSEWAANSSQETA